MDAEDLDIINETFNLLDAGGRAHASLVTAHAHALGDSDSGMRLRARAQRGTV